MESKEKRSEAATERFNDLLEAGGTQAGPDDRNSGTDDPSTQSASDTRKKLKKELSKAELDRRKKARRAKAYPHGPEAKALAEAEPEMPESLRKKIELSEKRDQWAEAFDWLTTELRAKVRAGGLWHGKRLCEAIVDSNPAVELNEAEKAWLIAWLGYFSKSKKELRSGGKYGPRTDVLKALGVADEADCLLDQIDALDAVMGVKPTPYAEAQPTSSSLKRGCRLAESQSEASKVLSIADVTPVRSIQDLPPIPRTLPFMYSNLASSTAKEFWRVYRQSDSIGAILTTGRTFALDPRALNEVRDLSVKASTFLDETMLKLGIPLS
jgi:hypothetical protein